MIGFETFDIRAWVEDGFTVHVDSNRGKRNRSKRHSKTSLVVGVSLLAAAASGYAAVDLDSVQASLSHHVWSESRGKVRNEPIIDQDLIANPDEHWSRLLKEVSTWEDSDEYDGDLPPTAL